MAGRPRKLSIKPEPRDLIARPYTLAELDEMSVEQLRGIEQTVRSRTLSRVRALHKAGVKSNPALESLSASIKSGWVKPVKGVSFKGLRDTHPKAKERTKLKYSIARQQNFLRAKTSTIKGHGEYMKKSAKIMLGETIKGSGEKAIKAARKLFKAHGISAKDIGRMWDIAHQVKDDTGLDSDLVYNVLDEWATAHGGKAPSKQKALEIIQENMDRLEAEQEQRDAERFEDEAIPFDMTVEEANLKRKVKKALEAEDTGYKSNSDRIKF